MIRVRDLEIKKSGKTICSAAELEVGRGERLAVIGPNGSGKTTLLRVIGGLESEFVGSCHTDVPLRDRVYLHQSPYLFRGSVLFNATYGLAARKVSRRERLSTARQWLTRLGIDHLAERSSQSLSGGERRRVALARALAVQADVLLLDEPFADLDEQGIGVVCQAISTLTHSTILLASPVPLPSELSARTYRLRQNLPTG